MAENRPTLTIEPKRKPSLLNVNAAVGLVAGAMFAGAVPFAAPIGLGVGAWLGKRKMQREEQFGKQVSPPSMLNLGTYFGGAGGLSVGGGLALTALAAFGASTGVGLLALGGVAACTAIGGWVGGKIGESIQKKQYKAAELQVMRQGEFTPRQPAEGQAPQQAQALGQAPQMQRGQQAGVQQASQQMNPEQLAQLQQLAAQGQRMAPPQQESMTDKLAAQQRQTGPQQR